MVVPGRSQVGRVITASGPLSARRDQPIGIAGAGGRVVHVLVDAGSWVHAGQALAIVDRSVQAQQAAQLAAQVEAGRANAALAQTNYERAVSLQGRGFVSKAEIDSEGAHAMPPMRRSALRRRSSAGPAPRSDNSMSLRRRPA